jgi:hypothetical protein
MFARRLGVPTVIALEYLLSAACVGGFLYLVISQPKQQNCVDSCFGDALSALAAAAICSELLVVGLVAALVVAYVRSRRRRKRGEAYPNPGQTIVSAATSAAGWGLLWAFALLPLAACGGFWWVRLVA